MNEHHNEAHGHGTDSQREEALGALFKHASARPQPSPAAPRAAKEALHREWRRITSRRKRQRILGLAAAAAVILAVTIAVIRTTPPSSDNGLNEWARVDTQSGHVRVLADPAQNSGASLARGMPVYAGQSLTTGPQSGIALRLPNGISLRVDQDTEVSFLDAERLALAAGRVYVDTVPQTPSAGGSTPEGGQFAIVTARGTVRHFGTQYMVGVIEDALELGVREGLVRFNPVGADRPRPVEVSAGQALSVDIRGSQALQSMDPYGSEWEWAEALGPGFMLDGRTMAEFLGWVSRETGRTIVYRDASAIPVAEGTKLHGSVELPASQALELIMMTSDLSATTRNGVIEIELTR